MFICEKCNKEFKYKYLLKKHENRKFTCDTIKNKEYVIDEKIKAITDEIENKTKLSLEKINICMFCNLVLSTKTSNITRKNTANGNK